MQQYINAVLVKIEEDRVVIIDGEEYLLLNQKDPEPSKPKLVKQSKPKAKNRPKAEKLTKEQREALEASTFAVVNATPNLRAGAIRTELEERYKITVNPLTLSYALAKLKQKGLLEVQGYKQGATWAIKHPSFDEGVMVNPNSSVV